MATVDHTPHGRGYDTSLGYFCHANDYWNEQVGPLIDMYRETERTTWAGPAPSYLPTDGAAYGMNGSCPATVSPIGDTGGFCPGMSGPEEDYEEHKFKVRNLAIIGGHNASDAARPLFLCYTSHLVHDPLQVVESAWHHFDFIGSSAVGDFKKHRQTIHAMAYYMDGVVGSMVAALKAKGMWENLLWVHQSDNGGPSFSEDAHSANNWPLQGSKTSNWQGGIRVNAFVSGGLIKAAAPAMVGKRLTGFVHACDWFATFCALAGVDKTDTRAALAELPPVDSLNLWPYLSGEVQHSPRTEIFADSRPIGVLLKEIEGTKWKLFLESGADELSEYQDDMARLAPHWQGVPPPAYTGGLAFACHMGPQYPNGTVSPACNSTTMVGDGLLYDLDADPGERTNLRESRPAVFGAMSARLGALQPTFFNPNRTGGSQDKVMDAAVARGGYWGPFLFP